MAWFLLFLSLFAAPFWESKAPTNWTNQELEQFLTDSPWAQMVAAPGKSAPGTAVQVYLATAGPIEQAERELELRTRLRLPPNAKPPEDPLAEEYRAWLEDNHATQIVVAVRVGNNAGFSDEEETRQMEKQSVMRVGRKRFKITGHFPPSSSDPYLRLAFPRQVEASDKTVSFELYLPGVAIPFREVEFKVRDMMLRGKLEI